MEQDEGESQLTGFRHGRNERDDSPFGRAKRHVLPLFYRKFRLGHVVS